MNEQEIGAIELVALKPLTKCLFGVSKLFVLFAAILMFPLFFITIPVYPNSSIVLPWEYHSPAGAVIASILSLFFTLSVLIVFELLPKESWAPMKKKSWIFSSNADKWKTVCGMIAFFSFASLFHALLAL